MAHVFVYAFIYGGTYDGRDTCDFVRMCFRRCNSDICDVRYADICDVMCQDICDVRFLLVVVVSIMIDTCLSALLVITAVVVRPFLAGLERIFAGWERILD